MAISVSIHPNFDHVRADVKDHVSVVTLEFRQPDGSHVLVYGRAEHAAAFQQIATIFNEAFPEQPAPKQPELSLSDNPLIGLWK